ncbi:MAG TPA: S8 family serine peptidase [Acidobacteriota bacterium]|nr:S8 family serine peptidase [Acidobacteriota bacterium]
MAVQFDTTGQVPDLETFFENHPTLDDTVEASELERGFLILGIHPDSEYDSAYADVVQDESVNRCVPVYVTEVGGAEIPVTDLVTVLFAPTLSTDSANTLLDVHGLSLVSVSDYASDLWVAMLQDSIKESPLDYANALHSEAAVEWATPKMYSELVLHSLPTDEYFQHQYWLRDTVADVDIDADSAWLFTRAYPAIKVAIIDDGFEEHKDLQEYRILPGWDCYHGNADVSPVVDWNTHGMMCAGVLMASHNDTGVVGVCGDCLLLPYKVYSDSGRGGWGDMVANAIYQAYWNGRVALTPSSGLALVTLPSTECNVDGIDSQRHIMPPRTSTGTRPHPRTGVRHQVPAHRIPLDVLHRLTNRLPCKEISVISPSRLPEAMYDAAPLTRCQHLQPPRGLLAHPLNHPVARLRRAP